MITQDQCWLKDTCSGIYCKTPTCMRFIKLNKLYDFAHISLKQRKSAKLGINPDNPCPTGEVNRVVKGVIIHEYNK